MFRVAGFGFCVALLSYVLTGCAVMPTAMETPPSVRAQKLPENFQLNGRVAVKYDGQSFSGGLRWQHAAGGDELLLSTPLGQGVARIMRNVNGVTLITAEQQLYHAPDAEQLTEQVLGWRLPLEGMTYWVRAQLAPGANKTRYEAGRLARLEQDGWQIDYLDYRQLKDGWLPQKIFLQRGELDIRLVIDQWSENP